MYLVGIISLFSIAMAKYHRQQNNGSQIGGNISKAKSVWLGLTLFFYFMFSCWWLLVLPTRSPIYPFVIIVIFYFYFRAIVQAVMMYTTKNWTTAHGIAFNSIGSIILLYCLITATQQNSLTPQEISFTSYLFLLICFQITDSFYAHRFGAIVGQATKGEKAIWFASNDPKFQKINQRTAQFNTVYLVLSFALIAKILIYDSL